MTRTMKDSGVEWIGQIPKNWTLKRLQYILKERNELNSPIKTKNILSLTVQQGVVPYAQRAGGGNKAKEDLTAYKVVYKNDIVLNSMNVIAGAVNLSKYYGCVSPVYYMLYNDNPAVTKYYNLLFQTEVFQKSLFGLGNGILVKESSNGKLNTIRLRIPMDKLNKLPLPLPSLSEQQAIANYLDDKCAQIDNITATINEQLGVLKQYKKSVITEAVTKGLDPNVPMKDSGVEWIGQIPEHWEVIRLKYLAAFNPPINNVDLNKEISYMPMECLKNGYMIPHTKLFADLVNGLTGFYEGDIVMAKVTPCFENGNIAIAQNLVNNTGYGSTEIYVFRCNKILTKFLFYYLQNELFKNKAKSTMMGTGGLKRVSSQFTKNLSVLFPPLSEQQAIADYLDDKCAKIDAVIADKQAQLETLAAYKKSLIYEYVTGKKSVLGFEEA